MGVKLKIKNGAVQITEKSEKKNTVNVPFSPLFAMCLTQVYAAPAPTPPKNPATLGKSSTFERVGLITKSDPANAIAIASACLGLNFSLRNIYEKMSVKKGLILLSIAASEVDDILVVA